MKSDADTADVKTTYGNTALDNGDGTLNCGNTAGAAGEVDTVASGAELDVAPPLPLVLTAAVPLLLLLIT